MQKIRIYFLFFFALQFFSLDNFAFEKQTHPLLPPINLSDWPNDVVERMKKEVPELTKAEIDDEILNLILKKLDEKMEFNSLKAVKLDREIRLVGEISASVEKIDFVGLEDLSEADALSILNINLKNTLDDESLKIAADRLMQHYRDQGYRFAEVKYEVTSVTTIKKNITFKVNPKKQTRLTRIEVEGVDAISKNKIEFQLNQFIIRPVLFQETLNQLNLNLRKQLSLNGYYLTQITTPQIIFSADELSARVVYKLKKTTQYGIEIINSKEYTENYLFNEVLKLDTYTSKDVNFGGELIEKMKTFYFSKGFPHVDIANYERKEGQKIITTFNIEEGPFTELNYLVVTGQISRDEKFYRQKFFSLASAELQSKKFIKEDIENAAKNLIIHLQNEGFVNARLGRLQVYTDREKPKEGHVILQIEEGPQVQIETIKFEGNKSISEKNLQDIIQIHPGDSLSLSQLEKSLALLKQHYTNLGFIEYKLINEQKDLILYTEKNTRAQLKFSIQEGPLVEVQSIVLEGNDLTHDKVILAELDFKPGDKLTPGKVDESIARLQRTGFFSQVEISTLEAGTSISQRTALVKVTERDPGILTVGIGATNENNSTIRGYTGIAYRNIGGWGRGLSARLEGNYNFADVQYLENKIILGAVEPYLLETRARLRANVTRSRSISDYTIRKVTELNLGVLSVEQDFTSHITGIWDLWSVATYFDHGITPEDERNHNYRGESLVIGSTGPTIDIDYRDNLFNPTKGSFSRLSVEYSSDFLSNNNVDDFVRLTGQSTWYFPFQDGLIVFAQSVSAGHIQDIKKTPYGIPFDKKGFTLGGRTTIRGFGSSEFFPSTREGTTEYIGSSYKLTSFSNFQLIKSELRFPLVQKWDLMGALFYDGGEVLIDGFDFSDKWRDAIGVGLRYNTPIGPLNLEYAHKLDRKQGESEGAFHLSVGVF